MTTIEITESPIAEFSHTANGSTFTFTSTSTSGSTYYWDFGDGDTSIIENPIHTYTGQAIYIVTLIVNNSCGSDTSTQSVSTLTVDISNDNGLNNVMLYPNPTHSRLRLSGESHSTSSMLNITILDFQGRIAMSEKVRNTSGIISIDMDMSNLSNGVYQLVVDEDGWKSYYKVSVSK
jgi:PKD repeat protein